MNRGLNRLAVRLPLPRAEEIASRQLQAVEQDWDAR